MNEELLKLQPKVTEPFFSGKQVRTQRGGL